MKSYRIYFFCILLGTWYSGQEVVAQLTVTPGNTITMTPQQFVQTYLVGAGVTISNATFNGSSDPLNILMTVPGSTENQQIGNFTTAGSVTTQLTFTGGVILSSGKVVSAIAPPNFASTDTYGPTSDPDLAKIANVTNPASVKNQAILEFDFVPQTDLMNFRYEFASEEFDGYCSGFNDAFGFFLSGPGIAGGMGYLNDAVNIALLPGSTLPVTISNVCANKPEYSWWNVPEKDVAYNRFTFVFNATHSVTCLQTYHIKLAICDVTDGIYDSGVFLEQNSFSSTGILINTSFSNPLSGQNAIEGCSNAILVFSIPTPQATDFVINLAINPAGTATQADFLPNPLPASIIIPAGATQSTPLVIQPLADGIPEGVETLILDASHTTCGITSTASVTINILDHPPLVVSINPAPPGLICDNTPVNLSANVSGGYPGYSYLWPGGLTTNPANVIASALNPVVTLTVSDVCGAVTTENLTLVVTALPAAAGTITGEASICQPSAGLAYHVDPIAGATGYTWRVPLGVTAPPIPAGNDITLDFGATANSGDIQVKGTNACGSGAESSMHVILHPHPLPTIQSSLTSACIGIPVTYTTEAGMSNYLWSYTAASAMLVSGGTTADNTITLSWTAIGTTTLSVNYTDAYNCSALSPASLPVTVSGLPSPVISGSQVFCAGTTAVPYTTDAGMNNYTWTVSPGNMVNPTGSSCTVDWLIAGSQWVKVIYTDPLTGCSSSALNPGLAVTVHALPVPSVTGPSAGCQSLTLGPFTTEAGKAGYVWDPGGGTITAGSGPYEVFISWNTPGIKQVSVGYTDANNCTGMSATHSVTVNATPVVTFSSPATAYCPNTPTFALTFGSPAGGVYTGTGVSLVTGTYYFNPSLANLGSNQITYTYTSAEGCQAAASGAINLNPIPDVQFTPAHSYQRWCSNEQVSILLGSSLAGSTFAWTAAANPSAITPSSISNGSGDIIQAFQNSGSMQEPVNFQVWATSGGCTSSAYPYTIHINPVASITTALQNQVICSETSSAATGFTLTPASGTSVSWTFTTSANTLPSAGSGTSNPAPSAMFTNTGGSQETVSYTVNTLYDNCPGSSSQFTVKVNPKPSLTNTPMSQSLCLGGSSVQVDFTTNTSYATSFQWQATASPASITGYTTGLQTTPFIPAQTLTDAGNTGGTVTYTILPQITVSSVNCSGSQQNYLIQIISLPSPSIQTVQPVCENTSGVVYLTASSLNHLYQWSITGGSFSSASNAASVTVDWGAAGTGSLSVTETVPGSVPACQNTDMKTINLLPRPLPTLTANHSLSNGICLKQTGNYLTEAGKSAYTWAVSAGGTITSQNNQNLAVQWVASGPQTVSVNYTAANGCNALVPSTVNFNVNPLPDVTISGPAPAVACQGLTSAFNVPSDPLVSFTWSVLPVSAGNLLTPQGQSTATYSWLTSVNNAMVSVSGLSSHGCSASSHVQLNVNPSPVVSLDLCYDPVSVSNAKPYVLKGGLPKGLSGVYSGEGVSFAGGQYIFTPASVSGPLPKTVTITYSYANTFGCQNEGKKTVEVVNAPPFQCENPMMPLRDVRTTPNRTYNTFWRGNRCWMIQNLDYGTAVNDLLPQTDNCVPQKHCLATDPSCSQYGGFYQWDELMQYTSQEGAQGLCPPGWHIPSLSEWQMLIDDPANQGNGLAGGFLKDLPYSATLDGILYMNTSWNFLQGSNLSATMLWTSTLNGTVKAWARGFNIFTPSVSLYSSGKLNSFPVRCVKD
ncbi:MAG: choice-of-anchor L domain-containing protein [Bacteroidota bacterium]